MTYDGRVIWLALALCASAGQDSRVAGRPGRAPAGRKPVIDVSFRKGLQTPDKVDAPVAPIRDVAAGALPAAASQDGSAYPRALANAALNARVTAILPRAYRERWKAEHGLRETPQAALCASGRVLVYGGGSWRLLDDRGKSVAQGSYGSGPIVLDAGNNLFYTVNANGYLVAIKLADGVLLFRHSLDYADNLVRPLVARIGDRLLAGGSELRSYPETRVPPSLTAFEFIDLDAPLRTNDSGSVLSLKDSGVLEVSTSRVWSAIAGSELVFAVSGRVYWASTNLKVKSAVEGDFEPLSLSLDESARAYLLVESGGGMRLWVLARDGHRTVDYPVPLPQRDLVAPPAIGYDHRIFLVGAHLVVALDSAGKLLWERPVAGRVQGASVTPDGRLLVGAGNELLAVGADGETTVLYRLPEPLSAAPAIILNREILAVSAKTIYCLEHVP